jgi:hypothetical protein
VTHPEQTDRLASAAAHGDVLLLCCKRKTAVGEGRQESREGEPERGQGEGGGGGTQDARGNVAPQEPYDSPFNR